MSLRSVLKGAVLGAVFCAVGVCASRWPGLARAFRQLDWVFASGAVRFALPLAIAASLAAAAFLIFHPSLSGDRDKPLLTLVAVWAAATIAVEWPLRVARGYGPRDIAEAARLAGDAPTAARADLASRGRTQFVAEPLVLSSEDVDRLTGYQVAYGYRSVFAHQAMETLRRAWLSSWDADRALDVLTVAQGRIFPDYRQALALLRAGPLTSERLDRLNEFSAFALSHPRGFESINESQYIFEAFSAAYARFSETERARFWLGKIGRLWPVYEKKIEVAPIEPPFSGRISGTVSEPDVEVALFFVSAGTQTYRDGANLCCSRRPDENGRFQFSRLGLGRYQLSLRAPGRRAGSVVEGSPGIVELSEDRPSISLGTIEIGIIPR